MDKKQLMRRYQEASKAVREAETRYLELRDAKSSGCCQGMKLPEILRYDGRIEEAHRDLLGSIQAMEETRRALENFKDEDARFEDRMDRR